MTQNSNSALKQCSKTDLIQSEIDQIISGDMKDNKTSSSDELEKRERELSAASTALLHFLGSGQLLLLWLPAPLWTSH